MNLKIFKNGPVFVVVKLKEFDVLPKRVCHHSCIVKKNDDNTRSELEGWLYFEDANTRLRGSEVSISRLLLLVFLRQT